MIRRNTYFLVCLLFFVGCSKSTTKSDEKQLLNNEIDLSSLRKGNENIILSESESYKIVSSNEFQNILRLQNHFLDLIKKAKLNGITIEKLQAAALKSGMDENNFEFFEIVFGSATIGKEFVKELQTNRSLLLSKNGILRNNTAAFICFSCKKSPLETVNFFFKNYDSFDKLRLKQFSVQANLYSDDESLDYDPTCGSYWQQVKLVACAALCSASTVGVGTVLCGWACWCMLCPENSALAGVIC